MLQKRFSKVFNGSIWNTVTVPENNWLIVEIRDEQNFTTSFKVVHLKTGDWLVENLVQPESWWISVVDARHDILLLHTYTNRGNPDHKDLIAVDIQKNAVRWQAQEFSFYGWGSTSILGFSTDSEFEQATIDISSGSIQKGAWKDNIDEDSRSIFKPIQYPQESEHFPTFQKFIQGLMSMEITGVVEYLEHKTLTILSFYVSQKEGLANYLIVVNTQGEILLKEQLGDGLKGLGMDTFFSLSDCLIFVKNKSELVSYSLYD